MSNASLLSRFDAVMMPTYAPSIPLTRGEGCIVWDADGRPYLDLIAGIAVSSLGHAHPAFVEAVRAQVGRITHTSNLFVNEPAVALAERLVKLIGGPEIAARVFLTNSGTEANEAALKLVRRAAGGHRGGIVAAEHGFHGRTLGALALTGKDSIRTPFGPFGVDVRFVPYGDVDALKGSVTDQTAAVFLEPTLGEGGVVTPPEGYLHAAREICDATGAALVLDEIQSGIGRTGAWFLHQAEGVRPDVVTLAKGLAGGLPIGACIGIGRFAEAFAKSDHGSTFAGNPVCAAAALAVLDTIEMDDLLAHVEHVGAHLARTLGNISHPLLSGVRGKGLWLGLQLASPLATAVEASARTHGFLLNAVQPDVIRLAPPLILTAAQVDAFVATLPTILDVAASEAS
jgi:acetylornithine aminotransferase